MKNLIKIPDTGFVRDTHSKAILNTDRKALNEYIFKKELAKEQNKEKEETKIRLNMIERDMLEIKQLIIELKSMRTIND